MNGKMGVRTDFGTMMFTNTMILLFANFCILGAFGQGIIVHPKTVSVMEGDDVTLQCEFNKLIVECVWVHNETPIKIIGRYQYSDKNANGRNTKNCSLIIKAFEKMDVSKWHCYDIHNYNRSISVTTYLTLAITVSDYPRNATIVVGGDIVLSCILSDDNAICAWFRNGSIIHIKDRYKYMYNKVNINDGNNTKDCSIKISNFSRIDATWWQCSCQLNLETGHENCKSSPAYLSLEPLELSAESTMNKTKVIQDVNVSKESQHHDIDILLYSLIGFLLATIVLLVFIYNRRLNKAKKSASSESTLRRARSRRSSRKSSPSTSNSPSPIVSNNRADSMRRSTLGAPYNLSMRLPIAIPNDGYITPIDNGGKHENSHRKNSGHHYQNTCITMTDPEPAIYEEIMDY